MKEKIPSILITVASQYVPEQSDVREQKFVWTYEITIENNGDEIVQLLNRFWKITDMTSHIEEIHGIGVIGLQPVIKPSKPFVYTSYCQLMTPQGTMEGHYEVQNIADEKTFNVIIPKFILSAPSSITQSYRSRLH